MVEDDLERAEERAGAGESKIVDLEEELRVIGQFFIFIHLFYLSIYLSIYIYVYIYIYIYLPILYISLSL